MSPRALLYGALFSAPLDALLVVLAWWAISHA